MNEKLIELLLIAIILIIEYRRTRREGIPEWFEQLLDYKRNHKDETD